jgi:hypothetical protein
MIYSIVKERVKAEHQETLQSIFDCCIKEHELLCSLLRKLNLLEDDKY